MHIVFSALLFIIALPPNNMPVVGCFFLLPILIHHYNNATASTWLSGALLGILVSSYVFYGAWSYSISVYVIAIILTTCAFITLITLISFLIRINYLLTLFVVPCIWLGLELALHSMEIPIAISVVLTPISNLLFPATYGGQYILEILLIDFQIISLIIYIKFKTRMPRLPVLTTLFSALIIYLIQFIPYQPESDQPDKEIAVSVVQTNIHPHNTLHTASDGRLEYLNAKRTEITKSVLQTKEKRDLIIWPEVNFSKYEFRNNNNISSLARSHNVNMLISSPDMTPSGRSYSSVFAVSSNGEILSRRSKTILIPYIEDDIFKDGGWQPHDQLQGKPGTLICFESAFPAPAATLAKYGAGFIAISTNESYAGPSIIPLIHLELARIRAIETGKTILRAANGGPSAIISSNGKILEMLPLFTEGIIHRNIHINYDQTFFIRHYDNIINLYLFLSIISLIITICIVIIKRDILLKTTTQFKTIVYAVIALILLLFYQHLSIQSIYTTKTNRTLKSVLVNFQNDLAPNKFKYDLLKASTSTQSLISSVTYLLRDYGNKITTSTISPFFSSQTQHPINSINKVATKFNYSITRYNYTPDKNLKLNTPCLALLDNGETVVIRVFTNDKTVIFSPFSGAELALKTNAFINNWTGQTITFNTSRRHWDI